MSRRFATCSLFLALVCLADSASAAERVAITSERSSVSQDRAQPDSRPESGRQARRAGNEAQRGTEHRGERAGEKRVARERWKKVATAIQHRVAKARQRMAQHSRARRFEQQGSSESGEARRLQRRRELFERTRARAKGPGAEAGSDGSRRPDQRTGRARSERGSVGQRATRKHDARRGADRRAQQSKAPNGRRSGRR